MKLSGVLLWILCTLCPILSAPLALEEHYELLIGDVVL